MINNNDDDKILLARCSGALLLLDFALKYAMSHLRVGGAKGENDRFSFFEKLSKVQLLTAEYVAPSVLLMVLTFLKQDQKLSPFQRWLFVIFSASRYVFALRAFDNKVDSQGYANGVAGDPTKLSIFGFVGATASYVSGFILAINLLL